MKHKFIILALGLGFLASSCNDLDLVPVSYTHLRAHET